jgi:hypothetical protein
MASKIDDDERTGAVGLFNTARSYWRSAEHLNAARLEVTHSQAPVTFLFCHAIELYLKAYLRGAGNSVAQLKQIGHRVANLAISAVKSGLAIGPEQSEILEHIDDADVAIEARYIVTGFKNLPTNEALSGVTAHLDNVICSALAKKGFPVRREKFRTPIAQDDEAKQVEEYIPFMTEKDKEIIAYLLHRNQRMHVRTGRGARPIVAFPGACANCRTTRTARPPLGRALRNSVGGLAHLREASGRISIFGR